MPQVANVRDHTLFAPDWNRIYAAGAALSVNVGTVLESPSAALLLHEQVADLVATGEPFTLTLDSTSIDQQAGPRFDALCALLRQILDDVGAPLSTLGLVVDGDWLSPPDAWQVRHDWLGPGPLYIRLPPVASSSFWRRAWRLRGNHFVRLVFAPLVVSQTRLLPDERAHGVLPDDGLQVPTGTAWVVGCIDLDELSGPAGQLEATKLENHLSGIASYADRLHATVRWPTAHMRHDSWLNRRLAIEVTGIGALVMKRQLEPQHFAVLDEINGVLRQIRQHLFATTHRLACTNGMLPALDQADPARLLPGGTIGDGWAWRWRKALERAAVRNRNLVALSPWSVFPPGAADPAYANLLPLLRHADVCGFAGPRDISGWNLNEFKSFHQRAAAVLQQRGAAHQIAVHA